MTPLRQALAAYLAMRRALGYQLIRAEKLLGQFLTYVEARGETHLRTETALAWATQPTGDQPSGWATQRLSLVRGFATHLHTLDPATEVPAADLLAGRARRATPYLYTDDEIVALIAAAPAALRRAHRVATYQTLFGLLAITGLRVGEAIALDRDDFHASDGLLIVRHGKFGKSREVPLHPTTVSVIEQYLQRADRPRSLRSTPALFASTAGTRLILCNVQHAFRALVRRVGLRARSATCRPRLHDLRHRFAVCTLLDAYRDGHDPQTRLARLATYLGHADPKDTYWYLSAAPELLRLANDRLERPIGGSA
jgi:integrase